MDRTKWFISGAPPKAPSQEQRYTPARMLAKPAVQVTGSIRTYRAVTAAAKLFVTTGSPASTFPVKVEPASTGVQVEASLLTETVYDVTHRVRIESPRPCVATALITWTEPVSITSHWLFMGGGGQLMEGNLARHQPPHTHPAPHTSTPDQATKPGCAVFACT